MPWHGRDNATEEAFALIRRRVPDETVRRLPSYLRVVRSLSEQGRTCICSKSLAEILHTSPPQIRKDLSYFGTFGTPGKGYDVEALARRLSAILKLDRTRKAALVGAGNLGVALLNYAGFALYGFEIVAVFDVDPQKIGKTKHGVIVENVSNLRTLKDRGIRLGIMAIPSQVAQEVAEQLVRAGISGILNFAASPVTAPKFVKVISVDIAASLACLPYHLSS